MISYEKINIVLTHYYYELDHLDCNFVAGSGHSSDYSCSAGCSFVYPSPGYHHVHCYSTHTITVGSHHLGCKLARHQTLFFPRRSLSCNYYYILGDRLYGDQCFNAQKIIGTYLNLSTFFILTEQYIILI